MYIKSLCIMYAIRLYMCTLYNYTIVLCTIQFLYDSCENSIEYCTLFVCVIALFTAANVFYGGGGASLPACARFICSCSRCCCRWRSCCLCASASIPAGDRLPALAVPATAADDGGSRAPTRMTAPSASEPGSVVPANLEERRHAG